MTGFDLLPERAAEVFGDGAVGEEAYGLLTVDVPAAGWLAALGTARDTLGCTFFDWLSAVDEPGTGFRVCAHVVAVGAPGAAPARLLIRTTVPHDTPELPTATGVYAGAGWHERETHEMFGVAFTGHPHLAPLLLPEEFEGHPLRKDFVLAARVAKAWPGAKEPGESHDGGPKRRQMQPPGVPDPNEWGPLKGQLPPAPARTPRPARAAGAAARPPRRTRTASEGSTTQQPPSPAAQPPATDQPAPPPSPGRTPDAPWQQQTEKPAEKQTEKPAAPEGTVPPVGEAERSAPEPPAAGGEAGADAPEGTVPPVGEAERSAPEAPAGGGEAPADAADGTVPPVGEAKRPAPEAPAGGGEARADAAEGTVPPVGEAERPAPEPPAAGGEAPADAAETPPRKRTPQPPAEGGEPPAGSAGPSAGGGEPGPEPDRGDGA
ncbi:NADH-quinone oxidoreductase subunit C [Streptomyces sp. CA-111067]|uniref:NADH-quinone oxidoreductase subunit C n=1 Tax=Streptomyces sp. CA-111067 TaxID=3240046 RepID=UPI003D969002